MVKHHPVLFIVGATGTGKSRLAIELARRHGLPIVNADSVQVYQRVNIGTAKATDGERKEVPHYLLDEVAPPQTFTAGDFRRRALEVLAELVPQSPVLVVGGSGFYVQALQKGMYETSEVDEEILAQVKQEKEQKGLAAMYEELKIQDPEFARKVSNQDAYRVLRALALIRTHGKSPSQIQREFSSQQDEAFPYLMATIGLKMNRDQLRERVRQRTHAMIDQGLIEEVKAMVGEGWGNWSPMLSVGYKETQAYLRGEWDQDQLVEEISKNTMRLAKRQGTWFRRDSAIQWFDVESEWEQAIGFAEEFLFSLRSP
ncbi:MAG: tRNA (adenosine(37)-N6)-dimethylallyltransferase MiaA [Bdellovibrionaceae bacterium]|nr:tRNA (adenosine(37)-N6)-dimethylallyltransferase MiaA [Bdellovibrionales bacterium]MCB9082886.1 tRNA (adenosine(37)-N6)-dimethylallyltransferase MiaA [Pseudobdellovibrionaceae bacterium]